MRLVRQGLEEAMLMVYERIIEFYTPYVLVRCTRYTNGRRQAQQIGAYALIGTCLAAREMEHVVAVGRIVEVVLSVVGPDVMAGARGEDWRQGRDEPLIVDSRMRRVAAALNLLKRPLREALVLRHVTGMEPEDLARVLATPAAKVATRIGRAERLLARRLEGSRDENRGTEGPDVWALMVQFTAALDAGWIAEVAGCAMDYLAAWGRHHHRRHRRRDWDSA